MRECVRVCVSDEPCDGVVVCVGERVPDGVLAPERVPVSVPLARWDGVCEGVDDSLGETDAVALWVALLDALELWLPVPLSLADALVDCVGLTDAVRLLLRVPVPVRDCVLVRVPVALGDDDCVRVAVVLRVPDAVRLPV